MSTRTKLLLILTIFALVPSLAFGAFIYIQARHSIQDVRIAQLNSLADLKRDRIQSFFEERETDVRTLENSYNIRTHLPILVRLRKDRSNPDFQAAKAEMDRQLKPMQTQYGYLNILLADPAGTVVYMTNEAYATHLDRPFEDRQLFERARHGFSFSEVQRHSIEQEKILLFSASPIVDAGGAFLGEVVVQADLGPTQGIILNTSGLGQSGEVVVARHDGNSAVLVYPTPSVPNAALKVKVPIGGPVGQGIQNAVLKHNGSGVTIDYRGVEVIAAWRYIHGLRWGLVTKIDSAEAFAPVTALLRLMALAGMFLLGIGILASLVTTRAITRGLAQADAALRRASVYNRNLIEASLDPLVTIGSDGRITDVNSATEHVTGRTRQELVGTEFADYFTEPKTALMGYQQAFREGVVRDFPLDLRHKDGRVTPVLYNATVYRDEAGKVAGVFAAARDMTEIRKAEEGIRAERQRLNTVLETVPAYVVLLAPDHQVPFANRYFRERFGESAGRHCYEYLFNRTQPCENCQTVKVFETKKPHHWEWTGPDSRSYDVHDFPFADSDGSPLVMEMGIDITERKQAENELRHNREHLTELVKERTGALERKNAELAAEVLERKRAEGALRESEERLKRAQEIAHLGSWELDLGTNHLIWSDEVYRIFGLRPQEFEATYENFLAVVHPEDRAAVDNAYTRSLQDGSGGYEIEHRVVRKATGEFRFVHEKCGHIRDGSGRVVRSVGMVHDITEHQRAEQDLRQALARLEAVNHELNQFAHIVSHDLKAPLRAISTLAGMLAKDYREKFDAEGREQVALLVNRVKRMYNLIEGILQYSRLGRVKEERQDVDLNEVVSQVVDMISPPAHIKIVQEATLPTVNCDRTRLQQVFQNLLGNAVKFMDKPQGEVRIGAAEKDGEIALYVADNGPGIDEKHFEKVFKIFQTLHARDEIEGTGIGLAIVKKIVEAYEGRLWLESKMGQGTTFFFSLKAQGKGA